MADTVDDVKFVIGSFYSRTKLQRYEVLKVHCQLKCLLLLRYLKSPRNVSHLSNLSLTKIELFFIKNIFVGYILIALLNIKYLHQILLFPNVICLHSVEMMHYPLQNLVLRNTQNYN